MYNDFIVKVFRYWEEENGSRGWDGWYFSKVYAIDGNEFLVYDNGDCSAYNGEEEFCETGFNWVDFTATMDRCLGNGRQLIVEPLEPFDIVEYLADRKTEPTCDTCRHKGVEGCEQPCLGCGCCGLYEAMTENDKLKEKVVEFIKSCARCKHRPIGAMMCEESCHYESKDEPQTVVRLKHFKCPKCGRSDYIRSFEDWGIDGGIYKYKCINCNTYIKDEPQTEREGE